MMGKPAWETYNGQIYDMRQQGQSLREIGDAVGITRERVRQILVGRYGSTKIDNDSLLTTAELSELTNLTKVHVDKLARQGVIKRIRHGLWPIDALGTLLERRKCRMCGGFLPKERSSYCSDECAQKGHKIMEKRVSFRRLHRKMGTPITSFCAYIYPKKSPYYSGGGK